MLYLARAPKRKRHLSWGSFNSFFSICPNRLRYSCYISTLLQRTRQPQNTAKHRHFGWSNSAPWTARKWWLTEVGMGDMGNVTLRLDEGHIGTYPLFSTTTATKKKKKKKKKRKRKRKNNLKFGSSPFSIFRATHTKNEMWVTGGGGDVTQIYNMYTCVTINSSKDSPGPLFRKRCRILLNHEFSTVLQQKVTPLRLPKLDFFLKTRAV